MEKKSTDAEREARIQRILKRVETRLRENLPEPTGTLEQIEQEVDRLGNVIKEEIEKETLDAVGRGDGGLLLRCECGKEARRTGMYSRQLVTLHGSPTLHRA
jgi:hypothetical protein